MPPEAKIIREQIIVVGEVGHNEYNDLTFTDKEGNKYKVAAKRKQYFENVVVPNTAVKLNYAMSSFGKEYIYSAVQVKDELPPPVKYTTVSVSKDPETLVESAKKVGQVVGSTADPKLRSMAVAYAKDLAVAKVIGLEQISQYADKFLNYILTGE